MRIDGQNVVLIDFYFISFSYLLTRFGILEESDRQLFFIVCHNFYNEVNINLIIILTFN